jgi:hypothetical protein
VRFYPGVFRSSPSETALDAPWSLLNGLPQLEAYMGQMCARPHASMPMRIAEALTLSGFGRETALQPDTTVPW